MYTSYFLMPYELYNSHIKQTQNYEPNVWRCWLDVGYSYLDFLLTKSFRLFDLDRISWRLF